MEDLDATVIALRGRLEVIWPIAGMALKSADAASGGSGETPDLLAAPQLEELFATKEAHNALHQEMQSIGNGMQVVRSGLDELRDELVHLLKSKANTSDLQAYVRQCAFE